MKEKKYIYIMLFGLFSFLGNAQISDKLNITKQDFITEKISTIRYEADKTSPIVLPVANAYLQEQTEELQLFNSLKSWFIICKDDMPTFEDTVLNLYNRESHIIGNY